VSRRITLNTRELGRLNLYLIYVYGETWEKEWAALQGHPVASLLARVPHDVIEHAILGFSRPLVKALGLFPKGMLHKLPQTCQNAKTCSLHIERDCRSTAKATPWCFEPEGLDSSVRPLCADLVRLWREKVYVVVVEEAANAG
jgi:hypothetical protein